MGKQLSLLFALVLTGGCSAAHEGLCDDRLHATVTIEETGEEIAVEDVYAGVSIATATGAETDTVFVWFEGGGSIAFTLARPAVVGRPLPLGVGVPDVQAIVVAGGFCSSSAMSEGELILRYVQYYGVVNCIGGSLRVRFADCDAELFGRPASETTLLVELGR